MNGTLSPDWVVRLLNEVADCDGNHVEKMKGMRKLFSILCPGDPYFKSLLVCGKGKSFFESIIFCMSTYS